VDSFTGCAGQRCMAGSVLVVVGKASRFIEPIVEAASKIELGPGAGVRMGALIDAAARDRLERAIATASSEGADVALDGRKARPPREYEGGHWLRAPGLHPRRPPMGGAPAAHFAAGPPVGG